MTHSQAGLLYRVAVFTRHPLPRHSHPHYLFFLLCFSGVFVLRCSSCVPLLQVEGAWLECCILGDELTCLLSEAPLVLSLPAGHHLPPNVQLRVWTEVEGGGRRERRMSTNGL